MCQQLRVKAAHTGHEKAFDEFFYVIGTVEVFVFESTKLRAMCPYNDIQIHIFVANKLCFFLLVFGITGHPMLFGAYCLIFRVHEYVTSFATPLTGASMVRRYETSCALTTIFRPFGLTLRPCGSLDRGLRISTRVSGTR